MFLHCLTYVFLILQDNATYDVVGIEPIVDNAEMLHHFVMFTCSNLTETPGVVLEDEEMLEMCEEAVYIWAPGTGVS